MDASGSPLEGFEDDPILKRILSRSEDVASLIEEAKGWWRYDLVRRKPGAAYEECDVELDLAAFMLALSERRAVINIPSYTRRRARSTHEGETVISAKNRHGKIIGVTANKAVFSFSTKTQDVNVVTMESVGEPRNFMMVDVDGTWYEGWKTIELLPKAEENRFLHDHSQADESGAPAPWQENKVDFDHFIDQTRWRMFYGKHYLLTMALIARLYDEAHYYKELAKDLQEKGVKPPERPSHAGEYHRHPHEELETISVDAFEAEVDLPAFEGEYEEPEADDDEALLALALSRSRKYIYKDIPWFRWSTRATEYAFHFYGNKEEVSDEKHSKEIAHKKKPKWLEAQQWEENVSLPRKRIKWNRIQLAPDISLRYRTWTKTEKVKLTEEEQRARSTESEAESAASSSEGESGSENDDEHPKAPSRSKRGRASGSRKRRSGSDAGDEETGEHAQPRQESKRTRKGWTTLGKRAKPEDTGGRSADESTAKRRNTRSDTVQIGHKGRGHDEASEEREEAGEREEGQEEEKEVEGSLESGASTPRSGKTSETSSPPSSIGSRVRSMRRAATVRRNR